jgi:hypothetical protein
MTRYIPGVPDPTVCPRCGAIAAETVCHLCKEPRIAAPQESLHRKAGDGNAKVDETRQHEKDSALGDERKARPTQLPGALKPGGNAAAVCNAHENTATAPAVAAPINAARQGSYEVETTASLVAPADAAPLCLYYRRLECSCGRRGTCLEAA